MMKGEVPQQKTYPQQAHVKAALRKAPQDQSCFYTLGNEIKTELKCGQVRVLLKRLIGTDFFFAIAMYVPSVQNKRRV